MNISDLHLELAKNFLATKKRVPHYEVRYIDDACPMDSWSNLQSFSDEEMAQLMALYQKYGREDFFNHLEESFDEDTISEWASGEIIDVDLDVPCYMYRFTCHEMTETGLKDREVRVHLTDATYIRLLAIHLEDRNMNINNLKYADKDLHFAVTYGVDSCYCYDDGYSAAYPYVVTMDEIKEDAAKIMAENPDLFQDNLWTISYAFL